MDEFGIVILAAGQGTRMKLDVPKPLAPIAGRTLIDFSVKAANVFLNNSKRSGRISLVLGHGKEKIEQHMKEQLSDCSWESAHQKEQRGTADALRAYFNDISEAKNRKYTIVMCADTPLITAAEIEALTSELESENLDGVAATFHEENPRGYGRIIRSTTGFKIVEEKDATTEEKKITEVNSGLYILRTEFVLNHLFKLESKNQAREFYLTDLFQADRKVKAVFFSDKYPFLGVNDLTQLQASNRLLQNRIIAKASERGVRFLAPESVLIDDQVEIDSGSIIYPNCVLEGKTKIGKNVLIESGAVIKNSEIADDAKILAYCYLEGAIVKSSASVGPFARLREGTVIGEKSKIGNFVETKKAILEDEVKVSHLSYVGDAEIGARTNIGCGFITCNYDGANKHKTIIGEDSFIGSDSQMIAPISIGKGCYVASGSTINQDMADGDFAIARTKQVTKSGMAKRFIKSSKTHD